MGRRIQYNMVQRCVVTNAFGIPDWNAIAIENPTPGNGRSVVQFISPSWTGGDTGITISSDTPATGSYFRADINVDMNKVVQRLTGDSGATAGSSGSYPIMPFRVAKNAQGEVTDFFLKDIEFRYFSATKSGNQGYSILIKGTLRTIQDFIDVFGIVDSDKLSSFDNIIGIYGYNNTPVLYTTIADFEAAESGTPNITCGVDPTITIVTFESTVPNGFVVPDADEVAGDVEVLNEAIKETYVVKYSLDPDNRMYLTDIATGDAVTFTVAEADSNDIYINSNYNKIAVRQGWTALDGRYAFVKIPTGCSVPTEGYCQLTPTAKT